MTDVSSISVSTVLMAVALCGCIAVVDFDYGGAGEGGAQGLPGGGGSGVGGAGCAAADLDSDPENCGTCGFSCGTAECAAGRCAASLSFDSSITSLIVDEDLIYLVTSGPPTVYSVPLDFTSGTVPKALGAAGNEYGDFARGTVGERHIYFAGQEGNQIHTCNPSGCIEDPTTIDALQQHINGMVPLGSTLYVMSSSPENLVGSVPIDPSTGEPTTGFEPLVTSIPSIMGFGLRDLRLLPGSPDRLLFNSAASNGCFYAIDVDDAPGSVDCASPELDMVRFTVTPDGRIVAGSTASVFLVDADTFQPSPLSDEMKVPLSADTTWAFAASIVDPSRLLAKRLDGSGAPIELPLASAAVAAVDSSDARYVVYAGGGMLRREPKPAP